MKEKQKLLEALTVEDALVDLEANDPCSAERLWNRMAATIENRSNAFVARYGSWSMKIGALLFDRQRFLRWCGPLAHDKLISLKIPLST